MQRWHIGEVEITRAIEFEAPLLDALTLFPDADAVTVESHRDWLQPRLQDPTTGLLILAFHTFVIRTPRHLILVDTCGGNDKERPQKPRYHHNSWPYLENLAAAGVALEDVDYVLCTHLHVDHVGWNTRLVDGRWVPTFPNAKYLFSRTEWEFWEEEYQSEAFTDDPYYEDSILPVIEAGAAMMVEGDHVIDDWVRLPPLSRPHAGSRQRGNIVLGRGRYSRCRHDRRPDASRSAVCGAALEQLLLRYPGTVRRYAPCLPGRTRGQPDPCDAGPFPDAGRGKDRRGGQCLPLPLRRKRLMTSGIRAAGQDAGGEKIEK